MQTNPHHRQNHTEETSSGLTIVIGKISDLFETICCFLLGLFIASIVLITLVSVWYRYVLDNPLSWTEQVCGILFVWITFLGSAVLYRRVLHIAIDMILALMPDMIRKAFYWINEGLIFFLALLMIWFGGQHALSNSSQTFGALEITPAWFYAAPPICGFLMVIFGLEKVLNPKKRIPEGELHL